jgi:hypothetical protein
MSVSNILNASSGPCLQVADGGEGLQIWRVWMVAANVLNKQSRTANKGRYSSLGDGRGANNPSP